jgi:hypothetical protein
MAHRVPDLSQIGKAQPTIAQINVTTVTVPAGIAAGTAIAMLPGVAVVSLQADVLDQIVDGVAARIAMLLQARDDSRDERSA